METDFSKAAQTVIISDVHLSDAEPPHPKSPLWKRFKRPRYFVDRAIAQLLDFLIEKAATESPGGGPIELILNGDIFDFDSVMTMPKDPSIHVSWLERKRGLSAEERKSRFKIGVILGDHPVFVEALRKFIMAGHRVVFIIGNHDIEANWRSVQEDILERLRLSDAEKERVRFCEWFYLSNHDTLIEHGNQYDRYSLSNNPINPLIKIGGKILMRIPFGNLAGRFMVNGMGLMNPHSENSFIKPSIKEYLIFYYRYVIRIQPFLLWTWFWGAIVTLLYSISEGLLPALKDPLTIPQRVDDIAKRANSSARVVWGLRELHEHPAIYNPYQILKELWLDRALILVLIVFVSFQFFSALNVFIPVSYLWFLAPLLLLLPLLIFYARNIESDVAQSARTAVERAPLAAKIVDLQRVIQGHTHIEMHGQIEYEGRQIEYLNTGTWSPSFDDVECTKPTGRKCFAWLRPDPDHPGRRRAELFEWRSDGPVRILPRGLIDPHRRLAHELETPASQVPRGAADQSHSKVVSGS